MTFFSYVFLNNNQTTFVAVDLNRYHHKSIRYYSQIIRLARYKVGINDYHVFSSFSRLDIQKLIFWFLRIKQL